MIVLNLSQELLKNLKRGLLFTDGNVFKLIFIGVCLIYNVMLVSVV